MAVRMKNSKINAEVRRAKIMKERVHKRRRKQII
jgi:hypothetical protein